MRFIRSDVKSSNQAMERTAGQLWFLTFDEIPSSTRSDAACRQPSLILFSLGVSCLNEPGPRTAGNWVAPTAYAAETGGAVSGLRVATITSGRNA